MVLQSFLTFDLTLIMVTVEELNVLSDLIPLIMSVVAVAIVIIEWVYLKKK